MKKIAVATALIIGASSLVACGDPYYDTTPHYVCPAYGVPGQPGYHPAQPPVQVQPRSSAGGGSKPSTVKKQPFPKQPPAVRSTPRTRK